MNFILDSLTKFDLIKIDLIHVCLAAPHCSGHNLMAITCLEDSCFAICIFTY